MNNLELFLGPPGTGKTTRLLHEVEAIMDSGIHPSEIAFVSFTRKAAYEARDRALKKFPKLTKNDLPYWSTLHSVSFRRLHLGRQDVMSKENWHEVAEMTNCEMSGYYNVDDGNLAGGTKDGDRFLFYYGLAHAMKLQPLEVLKSLPPGERTEVDHQKFAYFVSTLEKYKRSTGLLDFNDMLSQAVATGALPKVRIAIIDEAQDLSLRQWELVNVLFAECERVIVAGDDDQAIYEWSGADVKTFLDLSGQTTVLGKSFRLPQRIFNYADKIVSRVSERFPKEWKPDNRTGSVTTLAMIDPLKEQITEDDGHDWLLLVRNKYFMDKLVDQLKSWGVPLSIKEKPAYKLDDLRAIQTYEALRAGQDRTAADSQLLFSNYLRGNSVQVKRGFKQLPIDAPESVNWDYLESQAGLLESRENSWFQTQQFGSQVAPTLRGISPTSVNYYRQMRRNGFHTTGKAKINCSTIHAVKGGEADNVILFDGMSRRTSAGFDHNRNAEHRVWYVGATRARENLFVLKSSGEAHYPL